jgi:type I restriction enzyme S subunit
MSRIDELIAELCPDGVEFKALGDVFEMKAGSNLSASEISAVRDDKHQFPCFGGNGIRGYVSRTTHEGDYLLIGRQGALSGNVKRPSGRFYATEHAVVTRARPGVGVDMGWAYHLLVAMNLNQYVSKGAQPGLAVGVLALVNMPVPPLEVQREIVRILDQFTALEAELEARRRQYAHYRDQLLTFREAGGVRWIPMGELGSIFGGLTGKSKADFSDGNARFVSYVNVFNNIAVDLGREDRVRIGPGERQRSLMRGDILLTGSSETADEVAMSSVVTREPGEPTFLNSFTIGFRPNDTELLDPEFSKHLFRSGEMRRQLVATSAGVTRFNVSKARLAKVSIPVPSRDVQSRIAAVLDKFDALVNDLSVGLPAELAARRRQYEHYRDRLLTFQEAA